MVFDPLNATEESCKESEQSGYAGSPPSDLLKGDLFPRKLALLAMGAHRCIGGNQFTAGDASLTFFV
jgi:hypothetical protein